MPLYLVLYVAVTFRHSCLPVFAWRRVVLHFFDPKQLLRVSCILWCNFQSDFQPYFKTPVCGAPCLYNVLVLYILASNDGVSFTHFWNAINCLCVIQYALNFIISFYYRTRFVSSEEKNIVNFLEMQRSKWVENCYEVNIRKMFIS